MKKFKMTHMLQSFSEEFDEETAPRWLKFGGRKGSTMDNRWFWDLHIMNLQIGESIDTDFQTIERIE